MIVDKYKTDLPDSLKDTLAKDTSPLPDDDDTTLEEVDNNPLEDVYLAVKRVLESLHTDPNDNNSPKLFQTVKIDNGQFERIVRTRGNTEYATFSCGIYSVCKCTLFSCPTKNWRRACHYAYQICA